jgi:hypothetical protein
MKFLPPVRGIAAAECRDGAASSLPAPGWKRREGGVAGSGSEKRLADANQARRGVIRFQINRVLCRLRLLYSRTVCASPSRSRSIWKWNKAHGGQDRNGTAETSP